ncbi:hypothetical protein PVL29_021021 [Vitis rotundifolia]|uniref:Uncharacterized protein n=1 Tax=Vitis rotundifolia TaxID=103349 RepID=A0AA38YYC5_VITRO|nr:hypothetical protein PVL29_021021 [Vitis rotundifolia]
MAHSTKRVYPPFPRVRSAALLEAAIYLRSVKTALRGDQEKCASFTKLMEDYLHHRVTVEQVVSVVKELFRDHEELIVGFNDYLPEQHRISVPVQDI